MFQIPNHKKTILPIAICDQFDDAIANPTGGNVVSSAPTSFSVALTPDGTAIEIAPIGAPVGAFQIDYANGEATGTLEVEFVAAAPVPRKVTFKTDGASFVALS